MPEIGNTGVFSQTDASNTSGTAPTWAEGMAPSAVNDSARALQGALTREWNWRNFTLTSTGSANAYVLTYSVVPAAYYAGQIFAFVTNFANTGSATINVNSLGAKTVKKDVAGTLTELSSGDMASGQYVMVAYNGTDMVWVNWQGTTVGSNPQFTTIELGHASDTTLARSGAGAMTVEGVAVALATDILGKQTIWIPALAMVARTTNGSAAGTVETTTNRVMIKTLDFDTSTAEYAQFAIQMPKGWDESTLVCQFIWSHPATATNFGVAWEIAAVAFADDDAADTAFGTAVTVTDTGGTTNDIYITAESSAMTVAGSPGAEEYVVFQVNRAPANGSDTLAVDARLHGIKLHYTINAARDN